MSLVKHRVTQQIYVPLVCRCKEIKMTHLWKICNVMSNYSNVHQVFSKGVFLIYKCVR